MHCVWLRVLVRRNPLTGIIAGAAGPLAFAAVTGAMSNAARARAAPILLTASRNAIASAWSPNVTDDCVRFNWYSTAYRMLPSARGRSRTDAIRATYVASVDTSIDTAYLFNFQCL